jgi:hypothetical protein
MADEVLNMIQCASFWKGLQDWVEGRSVGKWKELNESFVTRSPFFPHPAWVLLFVQM